MTHFPKPLLTLLTALTLTACNATTERPINPNSTATFGIHTVLHDADGNEVSVLPERYVLGEDMARHPDNVGKPIFIQLPPLIDKSCLESIQAVNTDYGGPALSINLLPECAEKFGRLTTRNLHKRMALTINGEMVTAPFIRTPITAGGILVEGNFGTLAEAEAIARQFY